MINNTPKKIIPPPYDIPMPPRRMPPRRMPPRKKLIPPMYQKMCYECDVVIDGAMYFLNDNHYCEDCCPWNKNSVESRFSKTTMASEEPSATSKPLLVDILLFFFTYELVSYILI